MTTYVSGTTWNRNTNCIVSQNSGYNTTGIALNIAGIGNQGATLISNRHVFLANHVAVTFTLPQTVYFVNDSNTTFSYTITSLQQVGSAFGPGYTDISIGYLNTTVDPSLTYYKVFPSTLLDYLNLGTTTPTFQYLSPYLPLFYMDQEKKFLCGDLDGISLSDATSPKLSLVFSSNVARYNNSEQVVGGDSGNIIFAPVNGEIVLLGSWYTTSGVSKSPGNSIGVASYICPNISAINSAMTTLAGTSYSLTEIDMSTFVNY